MRVRLLLALCLTGCSAVVPKQTQVEGIVVDCTHILECPAEEILIGIDRFVEHFPLFNRQEPLTIRVFPDGYVIRRDECAGKREGTCAVIGTTASREEVVVGGLGSLPHELAHVYYWRLFDDPDVDHAEGTGPWSEETDENLRRIRTDMGW